MISSRETNSRFAGANALNDRLFFPLALLVALAMVGGAMMVGRGKPMCGPVGGANGPADYSKVLVTGTDLCRMVGAKGYKLSTIDPEIEPNILTITASKDALRDEPEKNAHFILAADLETVYAGQKLRITVTARPAPRQGAQAFQVNYSTGKAGQSGWQTFDLKPDWQEYRFDYHVPLKLLEDSTAYDYFSIRPVVPEKSRALEIQRVEFRRLGKWGDR